MHKELEKIQRQNKEILGDYPEKRQALLKEMRSAEEELNKARQMQDSAEDLTAYDEATEKVKRAERGLKFAQNALIKLDGAPRMGEADYMRSLNTCKNIMEKATEEYRTKAAAIMDQLRDLHETYLQTAQEINSTLIDLDAAANILQSKYTYREKQRQNAPSIIIPDRSAWLDYALRYDSSTACTMATQCTLEERGDQCLKVHDSVLCAAWGAVERGYPRRIF